MDKKLEKYYNYIVDDLLKGTNLYFGTFGGIRTKPPTKFYKYVQDQYGVQKKEVGTLWKFYKERSLIKLEKYNKWIVDELVNNTEVDSNKERIKIPSHTSWFGFRGIWAPPIKVTPPFRKYVKKQYGVEGNDINRIWDLYRSRVTDIISYYLEPSRNTPEKYNKWIVDELVSNTELDHDYNRFNLHIMGFKKRFDWVDLPAPDYWTKDLGYRSRDMSKMIEKFYGISDDVMILHVLELYRKKLLSLIPDSYRKSVIDKWYPYFTL